MFLTIRSSSHFMNLSRNIFLDFIYNILNKKKIFTNNKNWSISWVISKLIVGMAGEQPTVSFIQWAQWQCSTFMNYISSSRYNFFSISCPGDLGFRKPADWTSNSYGEVSESCDVTSGIQVNWRFAARGNGFTLLRNVNSRFYWSCRNR